MSVFSNEKNENEKDIEQIFTLEREFYIEQFRNPAYDSTKKIEKAAAKFAKKKKDSDAKFRAKALLSAIYRSEEKFDKAVEIVTDCADFDKISSNSNFPFKSSYLACFLELAHAKVGNCGAISSRCRADALPESRGGASGMSLCRRDGRPAQALDNEKIAPQFSTASLREAMKMLDYAERNTEGVSFATPQEGYDKALALFKYGDVLFSLCEFRKSDSYLRNAKAAGEKISAGEKTESSSGKSENPQTKKDWDLLKTRIDDLLLLVEIALLKEDYGEEYALYVKARMLFDEKFYEAASFVCRELMVKETDSVYSQAIRITYAQCLVKTGKEKEAKKVLEEMLEKYPQSPYLGEAMFNLGKIYLEIDWDGRQAYFYYNQALVWFRAERERKDALDLYTVPEKVAKVSASPDPFSSLDEWGRTVYRNEKPMEIVNSRTTDAPWYISEMEKECLFMVGFFLFIEGKFGEAKKSFEQVKDVDKNIAALVGLNWPNVYWRLISACNLKRMIFRQEDKKYLKGKNKLRVSLAELYFICEKFPEAASLYKSILNDSNTSDKERALALLGYADAIDFLPGDNEDNSKTKQIEYYKEAMKLGKGASIEGTALFEMGRCFQTFGSNERHEKALACYNRFLKEFKTSEFTEEAQFRQMELYTYLNDFKTAKSLFEKYEYQKKYPDSGFTLELLRLFKNEKINKGRR